MQKESGFDESVLREFLGTLFDGCDGYAYVLGHKLDKARSGFRNDRKRVQSNLDPIVRAIQVINESKLACPHISANLFLTQGSTRVTFRGGLLRQLVEGRYAEDELAQTAG